MKKMILILFAIFLSSGYTIANDFLEVPLIPGYQTITEKGGMLEYQIDKTHDEVIAFYNENLKPKEHTKFRDRSGSTYIEDHSSRPWHSITVIKGDSGSTTVIISKDSWTWIIGTLILRYIGVFVVLLVLYVGMMLSGTIISKSVAKTATK